MKLSGVSIIFLQLLLFGCHDITVFTRNMHNICSEYGNILLTKLMITYHRQL